MNDDIKTLILIYDLKLFDGIAQLSFVGRKASQEDKNTAV